MYHVTPSDTGGAESDVSRTLEPPGPEIVCVSNQGAALKLMAPIIPGATFLMTSVRVWLVSSEQMSSSTQLN